MPLTSLHDQNIGYLFRIPFFVLPSFNALLTHRQSLLTCRPPDSDLNQTTMRKMHKYFCVFLFLN